MLEGVIMDLREKRIPISKEFRGRSGWVAPKEVCVWRALQDNDVAVWVDVYSSRGLVSLDLAFTPDEAKEIGLALLEISGRTHVSDLTRLARDGAVDSDEYALAVWCVDDVLELAENKGITLSRDEALEVMDSVGRNHDAEIGINWDVISHWIDIVVSDREVEEEESE